MPVKTGIHDYRVQKQFSDQWTQASGAVIVGQSGASAFIWDSVNGDTMIDFFDIAILAEYFAP